MRIYIKPKDIRGRQGQFYKVIFEDKTLIEDTWNPELDACRALLKLGITGKLETWRYNTPYPCLILDIEKAAKHTVRDDRYGKPVFAPYRCT